MPKVLILGANGMLGSMVYDYLSKQTDFDLRATVRNKNNLDKQDDFFLFDASTDKLENIFAKFKPDYIINCIGIINKYCQDDDAIGVARAIKVNALFPYVLAQAAKSIDARVIQIATDCVFSGRDGHYTESASHDALDAYGKSKSLGEVRLDNILHIRCSIIGPEIEHKVSLLEWFLKQESGQTINGFANHKWNGVTTLQFAQLCQQIIDNGNNNFDSLIKTNWVYHYVPNTAVSKYELLNIFNKVFVKNQKITKIDQVGPTVNRTLDTEFYLLLGKNNKKDMSQAIQELANYMNK